MAAPAVGLDQRSFHAFPGSGELLALLRPEVAEALGGLLRQVQSLLGRVAPPRAQGREPAGVGDLASRGRYERLLISEWLLASELPDEFDRRAAMGEHLFLAPERRGPLSPVRTVVIFDAGPSQLGRPRIVQLAAALAFAERARIARVPAEMGIFQSAAPLRTLDLDGLVALVGARAFVFATPDDLARLGELSPLEDVWIVGSRHAPAPRGAKRLVLQDDEDRVSIEVVRPGHGVARRTVPVPLAGSLLTALRDPRRPLTTTTKADESSGRLDNTLHPTAPIQFTTEGTHLLVRMPAGAIVAHRLRTGRSDPSGLRFRLRAPEGETSLLAERGRRGLALLTAGGDRLCLHMLGKRGGHRNEAFSYEAPPATIFRGTVPPRLLVPRLDATRAVFLDGEGRLWRMPVTGDLSVIAWDVEAIAEAPFGLVMAQRSRDEGGSLVFTLVKTLPAFGAIPTKGEQNDRQDWVKSVPGGRFVAWGGVDRALCRLPDGGLVIVRENGPIEPVDLADDLDCRGFAPWSQGLVGSQGDQVSIVAAAGGRTELCRMPARIVSLQVSVVGRHVAAEDEAGHVWVFNMAGDRVHDFVRATR